MEKRTEKSKTKAGKALLLTGAFLLTLAGLGQGYAANGSKQQDQAYAAMDKTSANGIFVDFEDVTFTLTKPKGAQSPTGLIVRFQYDAKPGQMVGKKVAAEYVAALRVVAERRDACGSTHYIAQSYPGYLGTHNLNVVLSDHRRRHCNSGNPINVAWTAVVQNSDQMKENQSKMTLVGEPEQNGF